MPLLDLYAVNQQFLTGDVLDAGRTGTSRRESGDVFVTLPTTEADRHGLDFQPGAVGRSSLPEIIKIEMEAIRDDAGSLPDQNLNEYYARGALFPGLGDRLIQDAFGDR